MLKYFMYIPILSLRIMVLGFTPLVLLLLVLLHPTCNSWSFKTWSKKNSEQNALSVDKKQRIVFSSSATITTTTATVKTPSILSTSSPDGEFKDQSNICIIIYLIFLILKYSFIYFSIYIKIH